MRIGEGVKIGEGLFSFSVRFAGLQPFKLDMRRVVNPVESGPRYELFVDEQRCGAMWRRTPKGGGDPYLNGYLEHPLVAGGRLDVAAFAVKAADDGARPPHDMDLLWSPPRGNATSRAVEEGSGDEVF